MIATPAPAAALPAPNDKPNPPATDTKWLLSCARTRRLSAPSALVASTVIRVRTVCRFCDPLPAREIFFDAAAPMATAVSVKSVKASRRTASVESPKSLLITRTSVPVATLESFKASDTRLRATATPTATWPVVNAAAPAPAVISDRSLAVITIELAPAEVSSTLSFTSAWLPTRTSLMTTMPAPVPPDFPLDAATPKATESTSRAFNEAALMLASSPPPATVTLSIRVATRLSTIATTIAAPTPALPPKATAPAT